MKHYPLPRTHDLYRRGLLAGLLLCSVFAPNALPERQSSRPSVDSVLAQFYRAIGGLDQLLAVSTRQMWGTYTEGPLTARTDIAWRRPNTRRVNVHAPGFDYSEGYDGQTWELNGQTHRLVVDTGAAAAAGRRGAEFDESFVAYARKGHQVTLLHEEAFAGHPAELVRVRLGDGWTKDYLFDRRTGLILAVRKAMPIHAQGPAVTSVTTYEDWRRVGALLQPHRFIEREVGSGRVLNTLQWDSIRTNGTLTPQALRRPSLP